MSSKHDQNVLPLDAAALVHLIATEEDSKLDAPLRPGPSSQKFYEMRKFFLRNPDEELSIAEAAMKFDLAPKKAGEYLSFLSGDGLLERVSIYRIRSSE